MVLLGRAITRPMVGLKVRIQIFIPHLPLPLLKYVPRSAPVLKFAKEHSANGSGSSIILWLEDKFGEEETRESISAKINPPEVVERALKESGKGASVGMKIAVDDIDLSQAKSTVLKC